MSKFKYRNLSILLVTSFILVGCGNNNQNNIYEDKPIIPSETTVENETEDVVEIEVNQEENTTEVFTDEQVVEYINKVGDKINDSTDSITNAIADSFIKVVDFIFYDGTIGGRTFDSLKDETKVKILEIYDSISLYVDENLPVWKAYLGEKYGQVKDFWDENKDSLFDELDSRKQKIKDWYQEFKNKQQN